MSGTVLTNLHTLLKCYYITYLARKHTQHTGKGKGLCPASMEAWLQPQQSWLCVLLNSPYSFWQLNQTLHKQEIPRLLSTGLTFYRRKKICLPGWTSLNSTSHHALLVSKILSCFCTWRTTAWGQPRQIRLKTSERLCYHLPSDHFLY